MGHSTTKRTVGSPESWKRKGLRLELGVLMVPVCGHRDARTLDLLSHLNMATTKPALIPPTGTECLSTMPSLDNTNIPFPHSNPYNLPCIQTAFSHLTQHQSSRSWIFRPHLHTYSFGTQAVPRRTRSQRTAKLPPPTVYPRAYRRTGNFGVSSFLSPSPSSSPRSSL